MTVIIKQLCLCVKFSVVFVDFWGHAWLTIRLSADGAGVSPTRITCNWDFIEGFCDLFVIVCEELNCATISCCGGGRRPSKMEVISGKTAGANLLATVKRVRQADLCLPILLSKLSAICVCSMAIAENIISIGNCAIMNVGG